jgi:hypothetical protein
MKYDLYKDVELLTDIPKFGLKNGDIVKVIDYSDTHYVLEAFNVFGETIGVFILPENQICSLQKNMVFHTRKFELV